MTAVYLYPSLCFFEGTPVSVGRGTDAPFQVYGYPGFPESDFTFKPISIPGKSDTASLRRYALLREGSSTIVQVAGECADPLGIKLFDPVFRFLEVSTSLFTPFFDKLAGNESLRQLIFSGWNEADIRKTWEADLQQYKSIRSKYLLYPD